MRTAPRPPYVASDRARALHAELWVADLHADSLLWGRDLLERGTRGHVDVPRLIEGNVALQVLAASTKSPRHLNIERNDDSSDDVVLLAIALGWPPATWRRLLPRALYLASRADRFAARSGGRLRILRTAADLAAYGTARRERPGITAGVLAIEGAHALDDDPANVEIVADAGFRMIVAERISSTTRSAASAHGVEKGGLTEAGREMIRRMEARGDARRRRARVGRDDRRRAGRWRRRPSSPRTPASRGDVDNARNLDRRPGLAGSPTTGGVVGIGFWPTACGGDTATDDRPDRSARRSTWLASSMSALGSDFDGAVPAPFDAHGPRAADRRPAATPVSTTARSGKVMGGNVRRLLADVLP